MKPNTFIAIYDRFMAGESILDIATDEETQRLDVEEIIRFGGQITERVRRFEAWDDEERG